MGTVNAVPLKALDAYRDHGAPESRLEQDNEEVNRIMERLPEFERYLKRSSLV